MLRRIGLAIGLILNHLYNWLFFGMYNSIVARDIRCLFASDIRQKLPRSTRLGHPVGVVISGIADIGENVKIYQNVTIARNIGEQAAPQIGDNVVIYSGAAVIGDIEIGDNATIGANSVVLKDVPEGAVVAGAPARVLESNE